MKTTKQKIDYVLEFWLKNDMAKLCSSTYERTLKEGKPYYDYLLLSYFAELYNDLGDILDETGFNNPPDDFSFEKAEKIANT